MTTETGPIAIVRIELELEGDASLHAFIEAWADYRDSLIEYAAVLKAEIEASATDKRIIPLSNF